MPAQIVENVHACALALTVRVYCENRHGIAKSGWVTANWWEHCSSDTLDAATRFVKHWRADIQRGTARATEIGAIGVRLELGRVTVLEFVAAGAAVNSLNRSPHNDDERRTLQRKPRRPWGAKPKKTAEQQMGIGRHGRQKANSL
jgi:hypothetical protein